MRIVNNNIGVDVILDEYCMTVFVLENAKVFSEFVGDLWNQINSGGGFTIISEAEKEIKITSLVEMIFNPFSLNVNERRIISKILEELKEYALESYSEDIEKINGLNAILIEKLAEKTPYHLTYDLEMDFAQILKIYNIEIDTDTTTLTERIIDYIQVVSDVLRKKVFVFVNLKQYLSRQDLIYLYEAARYNKTYLVLVENKQYDSVPGEKVIIIDDQLCQIVLD